MRTIFLLSCAISLWAAGDEKNIPYAHPGGQALLLDAHVPEGAGPFPAAILVHGGGFDQGNKSTYITPLFDVMSNAGFVWFSIDYRLAPAAHLADAVEDVNSAIAWAKANASKYHVDPSKLAIVGESAGAFLVNYVGTHQTSQNRVAAVVDFYGPGDYVKLSEERRDHPERFNMESVKRHFANGGGMRFLGADSLDTAGLAKLREASPIHAVHAGMPPFLCIHGNKDDQVSYSQSPEFCDAIKKAGSTCELITIEGGGHGMSGWRAPDMQHWKPEMVAWLRATLGVS